MSTHTKSDSSAAESCTSTVVYEHEPFDTFRLRVLELATGTVWPGSAKDEIIVERLRGGGFNRIIGIDRISPETTTRYILRLLGIDRTSPKTRTQYILRIPRFDSAQIDNEVATLQFLHEHTGIPAPEVVSFDETENNALGSPYSVQKLIPGADLYSTYPKLSHEERCRVARELGAICNQMLSVRSNVAGKLVLPTDRKDSKAPLEVAPLESKDANLVKPYSQSTPTKTTHELLTVMFLARKAYDLELCPDDEDGGELWDGLSQMTSELDADGWLTDRHNSIAHLDFAPRNILANPTPDTQLPIISAILDWDSAVLAPAFMSCAPPLWVWAWQDDEDEDERTANDDPPTANGRELKKLFEEAAGEDYLRLAYEPTYRLARQLCGFAINDIRSNESFRAARAMLKE
ncbi:aminoglycoside phosphotransferase family protein, partial [Candidatus Bathyarchaeota archaeon]|nr:aminoglycoside phosphotransferase family protein [Candidatus Bathyarchaeota archaeon]